MKNNYNYNNRSKNNYNDNTNKRFSKDSRRLNFRSIYELYKSHFIENCELIILEKQNIFLDKFFNKMKLIIKNEFDEDIFDKNKSLYEITKKCETEFISDIYWPMFNSCTSTYEKFKNSKNPLSFYLTNFLSHCTFEEIAMHSCGSKFIETESNKSQIIYVICTGCKKCYFNSSIPAYCPFSHTAYHSKIIKEEEKNLVPATWEEYHCKNPIINEQMSCIKCGDKFWIKNDKLFCKKCKTEVNQLSIIWTCIICKKDFKSRAKAYNPLEYKEVENAIKEARLFKKIAKPRELPCKCLKNSDIKNYEFCHKTNGQCKGVLYYGKLKNEDILVCSNCNSIFTLDKFCWTCPICSKTFLNNNNNTNKEKDFDSNLRTNKKISNLTEYLDDAPLHINYRGTPIRESYVKKKPNDYYNISSKHKDYMNKRRNLSITFMNKKTDDNFDSDKKCNKNNEEDSRYNTNINFYINKNKKVIISNKESEENSNYTSKNVVNNINYCSPSKNINSINGKRYKKIQLTSKPSKSYLRINDSKRFASTSTRNHNANRVKNEDEEFAITEFKIDNPYLCTNLNTKKFQKYSNYNKIPINHNITTNDENTTSQIYIPKKKLDLNISHNLGKILSPKEKNIRGYYEGNKKENYSNSVGIRDRYKRINIQKMNNFYEKRNLNTMLEESEEIDKNRFKKNIINIIDDKYNNNEKYNQLRSSSQYKIERDKFAHLNLDKINNISKIFSNEEVSSVKNKVNEQFNNLKHKYNKRYIDNRDNFNYFNFNISRGTSKNIYKKSINNFYKQEKSGTNKSNGGENISINSNSINNLDKIFNDPKKINNENNNSNQKRKIDYFSKNKVKGINLNNYDFNDFNQNKKNSRTKIRHSFKNGGDSAKDFDNGKKQRSSLDENVNISDNDELKEFNFNDYKIITQLGQGTFGKIYLVQNKNNELFSMKKIILSEELDVQSVMNEYKMCQKLKHPNVVKILGIYNNKLDSTTYVVYVLMEVGLTDWEKEIHTYCDKNLEYSEKDLIQIIKQLSSVLSFLQKKNISHRDIKPQNILVFKNNIYKVADFGEAKQIDNIAKNLINYSLRGTELYMSPLLFNGLRTGQIDIKHNLFKSDVYSLGLCILYAAVTSNKPLYEIRKYVDMNATKKYLDKLLKQKYSPKFLSLLYSMLEIHEKNRPDFIELEKIMKKWK